MPSLLQLVRRPAATHHRTRIAADKTQTPDNTLQKTPARDDLTAPGDADDAHDAQDAHETAARKRPGPTFATLPPEIHLLIAQHLIYPDALSLRHANRYFYQLVDTGVQLKVEWLMERRLLHLECPNDQRCDLGSDLRFCRGSVSLLMQRRREHLECESRPGLGCLIYGTRTCSHARKLKTRVKKWIRSPAGDRARCVMLLASIAPLVVGWAWMLWLMMF